jgi:serralysin
MHRRNDFWFFDPTIEDTAHTFDNDQLSSATSVTGVTVGDSLTSLASSSNITLSQLIAGTSINTTILNTQGRLIIESGFEGGYVSGTAGHDIIRAGSWDNHISGGSGTDEIFGSGGSDTINGGDGDDFIEGAWGNDVLTGGSGVDRFIFTVADRVTGTAGFDLITDFSRVVDEKLVFSAIDANTTQAGDQAFRFIGTAEFTGQPGELRYVQRTDTDRTVIVADVDGDRAIDYKVVLELARTMYLEDFIL